MVVVVEVVVDDALDLDLDLDRVVGLFLEETTKGCDGWKATLDDGRIAIAHSPNRYVAFRLKDAIVLDDLQFVFVSEGDE